MKVLPFWGGPFSNWHICQFSALTLDQRFLEFNCVEQFMMLQKALVFGDRITARLIMDTPEPRQQKKLGRQVRGFDETQWACVAREVVKPGISAKFKQNVTLERELTDTAGRLLVEASPFDKIWGVGMDGSDPDISDMSKWKGLNWLGFLLTDVRVEMIGE